MENKFLNVMLMLAFSPICFANQENITQVSLEKETIFYNGTLTHEANIETFELYKNSTIKPKTISISSDGGDVGLGMELGNWIYDNNLNVEVKDYCLSSCANYIFTSGNYKYISNKAIIGFHGGLSSESFDMSEIDNMLHYLPKDAREKEKEKILKEMHDYIKETKVKESNFFNKINVNRKITTLGQSEQYKTFDSYEYSGWTYYPTDYIKLGVVNVIIENPPWELKQLKNFGKVFIVNIDDTHIK
ncbi:peptidase [Vibrio vulnificus]